MNLPLKVPLQKVTDSLLKEKGLDEFRFNIPDLIELLVAAIKQNIIGQFFRETIATNIKLMEYIQKK